MRKKQFTSALIILIILVIISVLTSSSKSSSRFEVGAKVFGQVDISKVNKIKLTRKAYNAEVILEKKDLEWQVKNRYGVLADPALIRKFLNLVKSAKAVHVIDFKDEDLPRFQLDEKMGAVVVDIEEEGGRKLRYLFGKSHQFSKESSGRYIYLEDEKAVVLVDDALSFIAAQPSIWLKKYLPFHQEVAAVTLYSNQNIVWKTERLNLKDPFRMIIPKVSNKTPQQINQLMSYVMQMRYMDIVPADNNFSVDPQFKKVSVMLQTFDGKIYNLDFLKLKGSQIRSRLSLIASSTTSDFVAKSVDTALIKEELAEWHFLVPFAFYEQLFKK